MCETFSNVFVPPRRAHRFRTIQVEAADVSAFGAIFVLLDVVDGALARRSKSGPTRVGAALDVESDSLAVLFLSLAASRKVSQPGVRAKKIGYLFCESSGAVKRYHTSL